MFNQLLSHQSRFFDLHKLPFAIKHSKFDLIITSRYVQKSLQRAQPWTTLSMLNCADALPINEGEKAERTMEANELLVFLGVRKGI